uniref:Protein tramtrack, beta isoform-like isoform X11 n=1 Tax=Diabrotica virgifera virgifera TaxID=50390 RepID=A0A6P7GUH9_DIAVI
MSSEQFSLCWDNFHKNMSSGMNSLLENEDLVDVTLAVQGKCLKAHKMVLSVCSPYFKELFKSNPCKHPIVFMKDVSYEALSDLLQFMYQGEVQVSQENLTTFIKTAEALQIKGLTGDGNGSTDSDVVEVPAEKRTPHVEDYKPVSVPRPKKQQPPPAPMSSPSVKRQRLSASTSDTQPLPPPVTKVEPIAPPQPVPISTPESSPLHFKTEPYEQSVSLLDETGDDTFNEDTLDETVGDDNEDYSMMESGSGEEPQAGTSTDGAGEGQDFRVSIVDVNLLKNMKKGRSLREKIPTSPNKIKTLFKPRPVDDIRFDEVGHFPILASKGRCRNCSNQTHTHCKKCCVRLCFVSKRNCFCDFHVKK